MGLHVDGGMLVSKFVSKDPSQSKVLCNYYSIDVTIEEL